MSDALLSILRVINPFALLRWVFYVSAAAVIWLLFDYPLLREYLDARQRRDEYKVLVRHETERRDNLKAEHDALREGGFPAEKAIRERQRMVKPGEKVLFLETPAATPKQ